MEKFSGWLSIFMRTVLIIFSIILIGVILSTVIFGGQSLEGLGLYGMTSEFWSSTIYLGIIIASVGIMVMLSRTNIKIDRIFYAVAVGFVLRLLWLLNANTVPTSDFLTMYNVGGEILAGDYSSLHGIGYIARFPHLTVMSLYMAAMRFIFGNGAQIALKIVNLLLGTLNIYLIYKVFSKISDNEKKTGAFIAGVIAAVFPPFVTYTGVFCTENIAITFYLLSVNFFFSKGKRLPALLLCGLFLGIGDMFRMVAVVVFVGYIMYILIYERIAFIEKVKSIAAVAVTYVGIVFAVSLILQSTGITQYPLTKGSEPKSTNILKGVNFETGGKWNEEDAIFIDAHLNDYEELDRLSKEKIAQRLSEKTPSEIALFYTYKLLVQWRDGDCSGVGWTRHASSDNMILEAAPITFTPFQLFLAVMYILLAFGCLKNTNRKMNLIYIIFGGYIILFLITEYQGRYALIASWLILMAAAHGAERIYERFYKKSCK